MKKTFLLIMALSILVVPISVAYYFFVKHGYCTSPRGQSCIAVGFVFAIPLLLINLFVWLALLYQKLKFNELNKNHRVILTVAFIILLSVLIIILGFLLYIASMTTLIPS